MRQRLLTLLIAWDIALFATLCAGNVRQGGETASAAAWSLEQAGKWQGELFRPLIDLLFWLLVRQEDHCAKAWLWERSIYRIKEQD